MVQQDMLVNNVNVQVSEDLKKIKFTPKPHKRKLRTQDTHVCDTEYNGKPSMVDDTCYEPLSDTIERILFRSDEYYKYKAKFDVDDSFDFPEEEDMLNNQQNSDGSKEPSDSGDSVVNEPENNDIDDKDVVDEEPST